MTDELAKKILVVEDEQALLQTLGDELTDSGFIVITAANGEEGLAAAERAKPDLIICDLLMPKMGGREMMAELDKQDWSATTPILILTNVGLEDTPIQQEVAVGRPVAYLQKADVKLREVVAKARELLGLPEQS